MKPHNSLLQLTQMFNKRREIGNTLPATQLPGGTHPHNDVTTSSSQVCMTSRGGEREELEVIKGELSSRQPVTTVKNVTTVTGCYRGYSYYIRPGKSGAFLEGYSVAFLFHYCNCNTVQQWSASCLVNQKSIKLQLNTSQDCHY